VGVELVLAGEVVMKTTRNAKFVQITLVTVVIAAPGPVAGEPVYFWVEEDANGEQLQSGGRKKQ
jgi:hypothetical protein